MRRAALGVIAAVKAGYLLGAFPSARVAARLAAGDHDVTAEGSGNPGALNAAALLGARWGVAVLAADMAKGVAAGVLGRRLGGDRGAYLAGLASIAGHVFPPGNPGGGGKGVATSAGATLAVFPVYFPIDLGVALAGGLRHRRAEAATRVACAAWVAGAVMAWRRRWPNAWGPSPTGDLVVFAAGGSAMILYAFARGNRPTASVTGAGSMPPGSVPSGSMP